MQPIERVAHLLGRCGQLDSILPPTALYNEGWMLRLVLDWASHHPQALTALKFEEGSTWYSEAILPSRFKSQYRGDPAGEGRTHADGIIGHFQTSPDGRGYMQLLKDARQLTVIEAKMASGLSAGTKNAAKFNQAARSIASIAHLIPLAQTDPATFPKLGFVLLAPATKISQNIFKAMQDKAAIRAAVAHKAERYDAAALQWAKTHFEQVINCCTLDILSWESVLSEIKTVEPETAAQLGDFYAKCLLYNNLKSPATTVG